MNKKVDKNFKKKDLQILRNRIYLFCNRVWQNYCQYTEKVMINIDVSEALEENDIIQNYFLKVTIVADVALE